MHYTYGFSVINSHLMAGAPIMITNRSVMEKQFWSFFRESAATSLAGVPYTYTILKRLGMNRMELPTLATMTQAGGKLPKPIIEEFARFADERGIKFFVMYGQTEAAPRMSYLSKEHFGLKLGSIGRAISGGRFSILNENGELVDTPMVEGELVYSGPNVAMGYAINRMDLSQDDDWGGLLHTGDLAYRDDDGFYYIAGRLNRFIKIFGNRVSLDEVESILQTEFHDCNFICFGQDDCLKIGYVGQITAEEIIMFVSKQLSIHQKAIKCRSIQEIPRLSNGKVNYGLLPH